jgi:hypothetical protein
MLSLIKEHIGGKVRINKGFVLWVVDNRKEIQTICIIIDKYPLLTSRKILQYNFFLYYFNKIACPPRTCLPGGVAEKVSLFPQLPRFLKNNQDYRTPPYMPDKVRHVRGGPNRLPDTPDESGVSGRPALAKVVPASRTCLTRQACPVAGSEKKPCRTFVKVRQGFFPAGYFLSPASPEKPDESGISGGAGLKNNLDYLGKVGQVIFKNRGSFRKSETFSETPPGRPELFSSLTPTRKDVESFNLVNHYLQNRDLKYDNQQKIIQAQIETLTSPASTALITEHLDGASMVGTDPRGAGLPDMPDKSGMSGRPYVPDKSGMSGRPYVPDKSGMSGRPYVPDKVRHVRDGRLTSYKMNDYFNV